ncbi:MAG: hypothetical protein IPM71_06450 [Bacteroidota bacterium]|nr:MAG: hypothetical protein IPM71_06450 [Bacteroidota bacterium]
MNRVKNVVLRALLIFAITGMPVVAMAGGGVKVKTSTSEQNKAVISLVEIEAKQVNLSIENDEETVIFYSTHVKNTSDFNRVFDFSRLADGNYVIVVKWNNEIVKKPIAIEDSKVIVKETELVNEPVFRLSDKTLLVFLNNPSKSKTEVKILTEEGVFFEDSGSEANFARKYDLSNLPTGEYEVLLSNKRKSFNHTISLY